MPISGNITGKVPITGLRFGSDQPRPALLQDLFPDNAEYQYDFRNADSYAGSTTAISLVDTPASGADKTTNYLLTNSAAASLFSGSVGSLDAKMVMDGTSNNIFTIALNSTFVESMHKTTGGRAVSHYAMLKMIDGVGGKAVIDTQQTSGQVGLSCNWSIDNTFRLQQHGDTGEVEVDSVESYSSGKTALALWCHDPATNKTYIYVCGILTVVDHTFNTTTTDASSTLHFFGHPATAFLPSGTEVYEMGCLSDIVLTPAQEEILRLNAEKDGRSYTDAGAVRAFSFTDQTDLEVDTVTTSNQVLIGGFTGSKEISVTGGEYRILELDGTTVVQDWGSASSTITQAKYVQARGTTSSDPATAVNVVLTVDATSDTFTITTAAAGATQMGAIWSAVIADLDATIAASADGTGTTWDNYESTPNDGTAQGDTDFTNNGYTFTGTAGSSSAYWASGGGTDRFNISGGNTAFFNNLPKTTGGVDFTLIFTLTPTGSGIQRLFHTGPDNTANGIGAFINGTRLFFAQRGGSANSTLDTGIDITMDVPAFIAIAHTNSTNITTVWYNTSTGVELSHTFETCTTNAGEFAIGAQSDGSNSLQSGTELYSFATANAVATNANIAAIIAEYETRQPRTY
jgi:hypothetical protein